MKQIHTTPHVLAVLATALLLAAPSPAQATRPGADLDVAPATRPCFIGQVRWNEALDGPVPLCLLRTSETAPQPGTVNRFMRPEPLV